MFILPGCVTGLGTDCSDENPCCGPTFKCNTLTTYKCVYACFPGGVTCNTGNTPCCETKHVCNHTVTCQVCIENGNHTDYATDCCSGYANPDTSNCVPPF